MQTSWLLCFIEAELWLIEVLHCGMRECAITHFDLFCSCDLDLDPMTFIYEPDRYYLVIHLIS